MFPLSTLATLSPPLSVCLSAPALRDEREEPLACDHHHHCDCCHSDCCLGDGSGFAEHAPLPKVQGMVEENTKMLQTVPRMGAYCITDFPNIVSL